MSPKKKFGQSNLSNLLALVLASSGVLCSNPVFSGESQNTFEDGCAPTALLDFHKTIDPERGELESGIAPPAVAMLQGDAQLNTLPTVPLSDAPVVIDNDQAIEVEDSIKYENLPTDESKTCVKTGATFPVIMESQIRSEN